MNNYLGDIISIFICLWFIKTYLLHYRMTKEEAFIVREAPMVFLYPLTILVCIMLILVPLSERGLVPGVVFHWRPTRIAGLQTVLQPNLAASAQQQVGRFQPRNSCP